MELSLTHHVTAVLSERMVNKSSLGKSRVEAPYWYNFTTEEFRKIEPP